MKAITDNYIYFYHLQKCCIIPTYPESISDTTAITWSSDTPLGRSAPVQAYSNSGPRSFSIRFTLHRDLMNDLDFSDLGSIKTDVEPFWTEGYVDRFIKYVYASVLPKYQVYKNGSKAVIPPRVAIKISDDLFLKGIITQAIVSYGLPIITYADGTKHYATADIDMSFTETDPYDAETALSAGGFRGLTAAFKNGIYRSKYETFDDATLPQAVSNLSNMYGGTYSQATPTLSKGWMNTTTTLVKNTVVKSEVRIYFYYKYRYVRQGWGDVKEAYWIGKLQSDTGYNYQLTEADAKTYLGWEPLKEEARDSTYIWNIKSPSEQHWILSDAWNRCLSSAIKRTPNKDEYSPTKTNVNVSSGGGGSSGKSNQNLQRN